MQSVYASGIPQQVHQCMERSLFKALELLFLQPATRAFKGDGLIAKREGKMKQTKKHATFVSVFVLILLTSLRTASSTDPSQPLAGASKHFVLVHGAFHGAWCWYKLLPLLRSSGHNATAIDLAASGIDPQQVNHLRSISDYTRPLRDFLASLPPHQRVILVGHSFGGLALSQAMERYPHKISAAVFLVAFMPGPNLNFSAIDRESAKITQNQPERDIIYTYGNGPHNPPTSYIFGPIFLLRYLYQLSPIEDWTLATTLTRPLPLFNVADTSNELLLTKEKYGSVKRVVIAAEKDMIITKDFVEWMIQRNPPTQTEEILGADHMVMMSKPIQLGACLLRIAKEYE